MTASRIEDLINVYRDGLLHDTLPFWLAHGVDIQRGGFITCLDRDGSVLDTDKGMWQQGRFTWLLATLHTHVGTDPTWVQLAGHGVDFIRRFGICEDGRMYFQVTREGRPLRQRRYVYTEAFGAMAMAAYAAASWDDEIARLARMLFRVYLEAIGTPGRLEPKVDPRTRPMKSLGLPLIALGAAQTLRETIGDPDAREVIDAVIDEIRTDFVKPDAGAVMETVGLRGEIIDHFEGRTLNPGHAIEAAWFILHEARLRARDPDLVALGTRMLDWTWARGWDDEYGGILSCVDLEGRPVQETWHDMKLWWPHNEAVIATLLAWHLTGEQRWAERHARVHDWAYAHFPDPEYGEWFGYLHRDGSVSLPLKGSLWKGPFHLPRMQLYCWKLLEAEQERRAASAARESQTGPPSGGT